MRGITGFIYRNIIKPILFLFPADDIHQLFLWVGRMLGKSSLCRWMIRSMWRYDNPALSQTILGLDIKNPVGLSAGFDYNVDLVMILPDVGFGFHTIGTITYEAYEGNPPPMLARLPKSRSLLVNKGLKNEGVLEVLSHLPRKDGRAIRGVSIGVTNKTYETFDQMIDDLVLGFRDAQMCMEFDYYELNVSCPNLNMKKELAEQLATPAGLEKALKRLEVFEIHRPLFIKMPLERTREEMKLLADTAARFSFVVGLIVANLVKERTNKAFDKEEIAAAGRGNFSGKPTQEQSDDLIKVMYRSYAKRFVIVGVGGIFTAHDAYTKIRNGASLVQMITGMVYEGPQRIGEINKGLVALLERDGYSSISQAIGVDAAVE